MMELRAEFEARSAEISAPRPESPRIRENERGRHEAVYRTVDSRETD